MQQFIRTSAILLALLTAPAYAESHALIMTIGDYINGVTPLQGSKYDVPSARAIANKMGVKDQNIRYYKDAQLTVEGIQKAFDELYQRVAENDQVFIYYSGHGGRWRISETDNRCAVALIAVDGQGFMDTQVQAEFNRLATKAQKVVMFADACHSGGVKTRAISKWPEGMTPKFWAKAGPDACEVPVNLITNNLRQTRAIGKGSNNFVYIAAARENEVSWDMGKSGGAATQAWRECITGAARDKDKSGGLSATEIQECAQLKMNQALGGFEAQGVLPSHVTIAGNSNAVLAFVEPASQAPAAVQLAPTAPVAAKPPVATPPPAVEVVRPNPPAQPPATAPVATKPPAPSNPPPVEVVRPNPPAPTQPLATAPVTTKPPAPTQVAQTTPVTVKPPAPAQPTQAAPVTTKPPAAAPPAVEAALPYPPAYYTLNDVYNSRDDRRIVTLTPAKQRLKVGKDAFEFKLTSSHAGYVYLLMVGSDGKTFDMIFPNKLDSRNEIGAGQTLQLPRSAWQITAAGPAGKDHLLAIVTDAPRDFSAIGMQAAGPFSAVEAAGSASRDIQQVSNTSANASSTECGASSATRTLQVQKRCSSAYGAALLSVEEVD